jgi:hypothetical protein
MTEDGLDPLWRASNRSVDPFSRQEDRPLHRLRLTCGEQRTLQRGRIVKRGELIEGGDNDHRVLPSNGTDALQNSA